MTAHAGALDRDWMVRALGALALLVALSPVFAVTASAVGYIEPLEHAAELTGASEHATVVINGLFTDYSIPGFGTAIGTLGTGAFGTLFTLALALAVGRWLIE